MNVYNTATERLEAINFGPQINIYVCGITPYDSAHLGHIFTFATYDILQRLLEAEGHSVRLVRNITDVDEPIYARAAELGVPYTTLAADEITEFQHTMQRLNFRPAAAEPLASGYIFQMADAVRALLESGAGYHLANGDIYFDTGNDAGFGHRVSQLSPALQLALLRVRGGDPERADKRSPLDFLLWKAVTAPQDPAAWETVVGRGRPGWHIECSVMSNELLNGQIDIHGGGMDLIFPHHEAEAAQNHALGNRGDKPMVKHWMHVAPILFKGEKMSKSLGNLVFAKDLLRSYEPDAIRLSLLFYHYQIGGEWQPGQLARAAALLQKLRSTKPATVTAPAAQFVHAIKDALYHDLDTPEAIRILAEWAHAGGRVSDPAVQTMLQLLGLSGK